MDSLAMQLWRNPSRRGMVRQICGLPDGLAENVTGTVIEYLEALHTYEETVRNGGGQPYSVIEIPKLEIADAILENLGLRTKPLDREELLPRLARSIPQKPPRNGFVYLMQNQRNRLVKIGFSSQPKYRERCLQSQEPEVKLLFSFSATQQTERSLHLKWMSHRVRGEWFRLDEAQIESIRLEHSANGAPKND